MDDLKQLEEQRRKVNEKIGRIEVAARVKANRELIGKTFRYRNSYSCPSKPSDYWWMWLRVERIDRSGNLICFEFQTDSRGDIRIERARHLYHLTDGYVPVSVAKFNAQWAALLKRLKSF